MTNNINLPHCLSVCCDDDNNDDDDDDDDGDGDDDADHEKDGDDGGFPNCCLFLFPSSPTKYCAGKRC